MILKLNLEGFYCDKNTKSEWSFELQKNPAIDFKSPERYEN